MKRIVKRILLDMLGVMLLIAAVLFGWVPGPGGIPLALAGLTVLSINHPSAKRLLIWAKLKSVTIIEKTSTTNPVLQIVYDVGAVIFLVGGIVLLWNTQNTIVRIVCFGFIYFAIILSLTNRKWFKKLIKKA